MKKKLLSLVVMALAPMMLSAGGIGLYIPYTASGSVSGTYTPDSYSYSDVDYDYDLQSSSGIGISFCTNLGKESIFGYQFALEVVHPQAESSSESADLSQMLHTFEFGVVNNEVVKFWVGPRINFGIYNFDGSNGYNNSGVQFGIAPAAGININFNEYLALAFDLDYKFAIQSTVDDDGTYDETRTGVTARFGVYLKFGEEYY